MTAAMKKILLFPLWLALPLFADAGENSLRIEVNSQEDHPIEFGVLGGNSWEERRQSYDRTKSLIETGRAKVKREGRRLTVEINDAGIRQILSWGTQNGFKKPAVALEIFTTSEGATPEDGTQFVSLVRVPVLDSIAKRRQSLKFDVREVFPGRGAFPDQVLLAREDVDVDGAGDPLRFHNPDLYKREVVKNFDEAEKKAAGLLRSSDVKGDVQAIVHALALIVQFYTELQLSDPVALDRVVVGVQADALQFRVESEKWFNRGVTESRHRILVQNLRHLRMRLVTW